MNETGRFSYVYPKELIAREPARPRDSARLLVYRRRDRLASETTFRNLPHYLPPRAVLVFNRTKVIPARFTAFKQTGGRVNLLFVSTVAGTGLIRVMSDRRLTVGSRLKLSPRLWFQVEGQDENLYRLRPNFNSKRIFSVLDRLGRAPLPPYIKGSPLSESARRREYQTVFARERGSVAAPTASLHFSRRLLTSLKAAGFDVRFVTLHVGLGTFAPVTEQNLKQGRLHAEAYRIAPSTAKFLNQARAAGRPIIAVGTTVCRTLEAAAVDRGKLTRLSGETDIFIRENHVFRFTDGLITNFHVPRSSLMMLVSALVGRRKLLELYRMAIASKFRLFSFGDGMLIF